jgi:Putative zinc-binding metallo-peptidase
MSTTRVLGRTVPGARRRRRVRAVRAWTRLSDEELLKMRFCDLKLSIERSPLKHHVRRLYADLARRGIALRPHVWLSQEWFSPDGVPGIAVPFYLAHPRLERLERHIMREAEGGKSRLLMRILRHEAGHALDNAYRLRRRRRWREVFGPASQPYPARYRARAGSRRYVHHLGEWYAQAHPTEDFAETFAVWLTPTSGWRRACTSCRRSMNSSPACALSGRRCATARASSPWSTTSARLRPTTAASSPTTASSVAAWRMSCCGARFAPPPRRASR